MNFGMKLLTILNLLGVAQGLLLALALVTLRRGNRPANGWLAALVATISLLVGGAILFTTRQVLVYPHLAYLHHPFLYLVAPLLWLYLRALTEREPQTAWQDWLHLLPFVLCLIYLMPFYLQDAEVKRALLAGPLYERWYRIRHGLAFVQVIGYVPLITQVLRQQAQRVKLQNRLVDRAVFRQMLVIVLAILVVLLGGAVRFALKDRSLETNLLLPLIGSIVVYVIAYLSLRHPEALIGPFEQTAIEAPPVVKKYERSTLTPERADDYLRKLQQAMESNKLYTDSELTLQKLASVLSIPAPHLSQVINEQLGQSFTDLINAYRVEDAKRRLLDPTWKHYSILAIAEEAGFSSKSTFNAVFKKHTGQTPSEFRASSNLVESA